MSINIYDLDWSLYNPAQGFWKAQYSTGRIIYIQPDLEPGRWYWTIIWAGNKEKFDKKKGVVIEERPRVSAWGTSPTLEKAKMDAIERAQKPRPRTRAEHVEEGTLFT